MEDGLTFVKAAAAASPEKSTKEYRFAPHDSESLPSPAPQPTISPASGTEGNAANTPPQLPTKADAALKEAFGWGGTFGPPYSAIFVDVDNKDTSVGMSCPPAAFLESAFLKDLKTILHGGGGSVTGTGRPPGVLAVNVAARSKELFDGAVGAVCEVFPDGEVC